MGALIRPAILTTTDQGEPLVLGMGDRDQCWSEEDFRSIKSDLGYVVNFMANEPLFVADFSAKKLLRLITQLESAAVDRSAQEQGLVDVLIHLYAFLSSSRAFVDQTDRELKRRFGVESAERVGFRSALNVMYDGSAEYRFLYALRNYAQHRSVPLARNHHTASRLVNPGGQDEYVDDTFEVTSDRDALLDDSEWKPVVRDWLRAQDPSFAIAPLVSRGIDCLRIVGLELYRLLAPHVILAHERATPFWDAFIHPPPPVAGSVDGTVGYLEIDASSRTAPTAMAFVEVPEPQYRSMLSLARHLLDENEPSKVLVTCMPLEGRRWTFEGT